MTIDLATGELKELNVAMQPKAISPQLEIIEFIIGTWLDIYDEPWAADDGLYVALRNNGASAVSGICHMYDWQAWWHNPPGDDRHWGQIPFNIEPGQIGYLWFDWVRHLYGDPTYVRVEVIVNDQIVLASPQVYYPPGKHNWTPNTDAAECVYHTPGLAVIWYGSEDAVTNNWSWLYRTPPSCQNTSARPCDHYRSGDWRMDRYYSPPDWWPDVFLVFFDQFIEGAEYRVKVRGYRSVWFNFIF